MRALALLLLSAIVLYATPAAAGVLERLRETGVLKVGVRTDARPYSYSDEKGQPAGYTVELCKAVAEWLREEPGLDALTLDFVPVTAEDRFDAVASGRIDLLCGATTATLSRREKVDFSLMTFIDGASVLFRSDGPRSFTALEGQQVGVRDGVTTQEALRGVLEDLGVELEVVTVPDHLEGLRRLEAGEIAAYFGDQAILYFLKSQSAQPEGLDLSKQVFTREPYALALPLGDQAFRLAVDRALSRIFREGEIDAIFAKAFPKAKPSEIVRALYMISGLPE